MTSRTQQALAMVASGAAVAEAAEACGVAQSTIRVAQSKRQGREICPCCGQVVRVGFDYRVPSKTVQALKDWLLKQSQSRAA